MNNKYSDIDNLFREKFENFAPEPPAGIWENILRKISGGSKGGMFLKLILIPFLAAGLFLFFTSPVAHLNIGKNLWDTIRKPVLSKKKDVSQKDAGVLDLGKTESRPRISKPEATSAVQAVQKQHSALQPVQGDFDIPVSRVDYRRNIAFAAVRKAQGFAAKSHPELRPKLRAKRNRGSWRLAASFLPEFISYDANIQFGLNGQNTNRQNNFYFTAQYLKDNYFIESGIGYGRVLDRSAAEVSYKKYLGSWNDLYDVTTEVNEQGEEVAVYHYRKVDVYDTVASYRYSDALTSYDYLQVPLLVGVKKNAGRINWTLKAGGVFSYIVRKAQHVDTGTDGQFLDSKVLIPGRRKELFQVVISAGVEYQITNRLSFSFEPSFKRNINNSFSADRKMTKPYSFGVRTGILFKLK